MQMQMTPGEIRRDYESAKKKKEQLQILADLNACSVQDIIEVLVSEGMDRRGFSWAYREKLAKIPIETAIKEQQATPAGDPPPTAESRTKADLKPVRHDYKAALAAIRTHIEGLRAEQAALRARDVEIDAEIGEIQGACQELADWMD